MESQQWRIVSATRDLYEKAWSNPKTKRTARVSIDINPTIFFAVRFWPELQIALEPIEKYFIIPVAIYSYVWKLQDFLLAVFRVHKIWSTFYDNN